MQNKLLEELEDKLAIKWYAALQVTLSRTTPEGEMVFITPYFRTKCASKLKSPSVDIRIKEGFAKITKSFKQYTQRRSGSTMERTKRLEVRIAEFQQLSPPPRKHSG